MNIVVMFYMIEKYSSSLHSTGFPIMYLRIFFSDFSLLMIWLKNCACYAKSVQPTSRMRFVQVDLYWLLITPNVPCLQFRYSGIKI